VHSYFCLGFVFLDTLIYSNAGFDWSIILLCNRFLKEMKAGNYCYYYYFFKYIQRNFHALILPLF
jgi:hypothetical protein